MRKYKRTLVLTKADLNLSGRLKKIEKLGIEDIMNSFHEICMADFVIYIHEGKFKIFKDRLGEF